MRRQEPDNREFLRRTSFIIAEYTVNEGTFRDIIKNISAGGLFVRTSRPISVGQDIKLSFPLFDFNQDVTVHGKIVKIDHTGFAVQFFKPIEELVSENGKFPEIVHETDR